MPQTLNAGSAFRRYSLLKLSGDMPEESGSATCAGIGGSAGIVDYDDLQDMRRGAGQLRADDSVFAAEAGYDAISGRAGRSEEGEVYCCVLRRSAPVIGR